MEIAVLMYSFKLEDETGVPKKLVVESPSSIGSSSTASTS